MSAIFSWPWLMERRWNKISADLRPRRPRRLHLRNASHMSTCSQHSCWGLVPCADVTLAAPTRGATAPLDSPTLAEAYLVARVSPPSASNLLFLEWLQIQHVARPPISYHHLPVHGGGLDARPFIIGRVDDLASSILPPEAKEQPKHSDWVSPDRLSLTSASLLSGNHMLFMIMRLRGAASPCCQRRRNHSV
ncbi:hypothetical protein BKA62DRAFT_421269 [Auriculariales sp. MPI-PUGE-AT-0066]|nr:hypothetical protein BKA62DRAFT_421269 [Auriculariales sp. MPI-PUGE-AT-0066]